jgi:cytidyltransferase-like protein
MLHSGHVAFFEEAASHGDLYVGLGSDQTIWGLKARKTINNNAERLYMVKAIKFVKDAWINSGSGLDLPIAAGVLASCAYIDAVKAWEYGIIGELSLEGRVLGVSGVLPMIICMRDSGIRKVIIPAENAMEASLVSGMEIYPVRSLTECIEIINGGGNAESISIAVSGTVL